MTQYDAVFSAATHLTLEERLRLIDDLQATVPEEHVPELSPEWEAEIDRRWEQIRSGAVKTVPWEAVEKELQAIIERKDVG